MLMKDNKKNMATLIVAKLGKKPEMEEAPKNEMGDEMDKSIPMESAGEEIMKALESKDAKALASAICDLMDMHMNSNSEEKEEKEEKY